MKFKSLAQDTCATIMYSLLVHCQSFCLYVRGPWCMSQGRFRIFFHWCREMLRNATKRHHKRKYIEFQNRLKLDSTKIFVISSFSGLALGSLKRTGPSADAAISSRLLQRPYPTLPLPPTQENPFEDLVKDFQSHYGPYKPLEASKP